MRGLCFLLSISVAISSRAQEPAELPRSIRSARASTAPRIDGRLDEPVWSEALPATGFVQVSPVERAPATVDTEVRVLHLGSHLYIGAHLKDPTPDQIQRHLARRDQPTQADVFSVSLDPQRSRRTAYRFEVNASGIQRDVLLFDDVVEDERWDAVWDSAVTVDATGWTVELAIPLSQLRADRSVETWGIQVSRFVFRLRELSAYQFIPARQGVNVSQFAELTGLEGLDAKVNLELRPYIAGGGSFYPRTDVLDPFRTGAELGFKVGGDAKYSPAPNWYLNATVNPDFGQVEADPALVNLGDVQLFFPEKRPFFLEGLDVFGNDTAKGDGNDPPPTSLFYSRRIGAPPRAFAVDPPEQAAYATRATETPIYGAVKVTGRSSSGFSLGFVDALTAPVAERFADAQGARLDPDQRLVQPLTNFSLLRMNQELGGGSSRIGLVAVSAQRARPGEGVLDSQLSAFSFAGGPDWQMRFGEKSYFVAGRLLTSHVRGSPERMTSLQRNFTRYLQRPDARHLEVDPDATSLTGWLGELQAGRSGDAHLNFDLGATLTTPLFEVNDTGFQNRADELAVKLNAIWQEKEPGPLLKNWSVSANLISRTNLGGDRLPSYSSINFDALTVGFNPLGASLIFAPPSQDDRLLRGGPSAAAPLDWGVYVRAGTDIRRKLRFNAYGNAGGSLAGGHDFVAGFNFNAEPIPALTVQLNPNIYFRRGDAQFVTSYLDDAAADTFGRRYVFAELNDVQSSVTLRLDCTLSPTLGIQTFFRFGVTSGAYKDYKTFARPRERAFELYGEGLTTNGDGSFNVRSPGATAATTFQDPNFVFSSLQGNAALRWEYRPGSTLFVVYQLDCAGVTSDGSFTVGRYGNLCAGSGLNNTVLLKASYWWSP